MKAKKNCAMCKKHYGDREPCDEGKPVASPHRKKCGVNGCVLSAGHDRAHRIPIMMDAGLARLFGFVR